MDHRKIIKLINTEWFYELNIIKWLILIFISILNENWYLQNKHPWLSEFLSGNFFAFEHAWGDMVD